MRRAVPLAEELPVDDDMEEAVLSAGAFVGLVVSGSETWGEWVGGSVAALLILPWASIATALVYNLLSQH